MENYKGAEPLDEEAQAERAKRSSILMLVRCRRGDGTESVIKVRNVSSTGLRGDCADIVDFDSDEPVKLIFRNTAPVSASVVWSESGEVGFTFGKVIEIDRVVQAHSRQLPPGDSPRSEKVRSWIDSGMNQRAVEMARLAASGKRPI